MHNNLCYTCVYLCTGADTLKRCLIDIIVTFNYCFCGDEFIVNDRNASVYDTYLNSFEFCYFLFDKNLNSFWRTLHSECYEYSKKILQLEMLQ